MAYIQQTGSAISDSALVSMSVWARIPSAGAGGAQPIQLIDVSDGAGTTSFQVQVLGTNFGSTTGRVDWFGGQFVSPFVFTQWSSSVGAVQFDAWNHIFVCLDTGHAGASPSSGGGSLQDPPTDPKVGWCYVNGANVSTGDPSNFPSDNVLSYPENDRSTVNPDTGDFGTYSYVNNFNGGTIGIPTSADTYVSTNPKMEMSDLQLWVGKFIDPTVSANFAKFVSISGGIGRPVDPAIAATAFGEQTLLHMGGANAFFINRGTGGAFTKAGTISDYTPVPSYG